MTSFGTGPWGTGSYGVATTLTVTHAYVINTHEVVVVLSKPPLDRLALLPGDVRNILSWELMLQTATTIEILEIAEIRPYKGPLEWAVRSAMRLPDANHLGRITATTLKDAAGNITGLPNYADFIGVTEHAVSTPTAKAAARGAGARDLSNLPTPTIGGESNLSGTLTIRGGDYALVEGPALLKKLIIRRLTTTPGDFFHLPNYGAGLRVKEPIPAGDLVRFRARLERELLREPDIDSVTTSVTQSQNTLTVKVRARMSRTGQDVSVGLFSPIGQS